MLERDKFWQLWVPSSKFLHLQEVAIGYLGREKHHRYQKSHGLFMVTQTRDDKPTRGSGWTRAVWPFFSFPGREISLAGAATSIIFVATKFCRDKLSFVATNTCLLKWQNVFCRDKSMLAATNTCLSRQKFCRNKHTFVVTKDVFCHVIHVFVATKLSLS